MGYSQDEDPEILSIQYWKQKDKQVKVDDIPISKFSPLKNAILGFNKDTIWFEVKVTPFDTSKEVSFLLNETSGEYIEVYQKNKLLYQSNTTPICNPLISDLHIDFKEPLYLKIKFHGHVYFQPSIFFSKGIELYKTRYLFGNGWYYGFVFMVFVVNIFFFLSLKNKPFLYYALFIFFIHIGISFYDGVLDLWVDLSFFDDFIPLIHLIISFTGFCFASSFLNLDQSYPKSKYISWGLLSISAIFFSIFALTNDFAFFAYGDLFAYLVLIFYWFMGILMLKKHEYAAFFVIGYALIMFAGLFHLIPLNFGVHMFPLSYSTVKIGGLFEMLILSYAITYRVKSMQIENVMFKKELNIYMDKLLSLEDRLSLEQPVSEQSSNVMNKIQNLATQFELTDREVDVLLCIANQNTNSQIAEELFISVNTVKFHTRNIYQKLDINSKTDAINIVGA